MSALAKIKSRGTIVSQYVAAAYVAMAGLQSVDISGEKSETNDTTTLDGGVYKTKDPTGYVDPPTIKLSGLYDPAHATYTAFAGLVSSPAATNFKVTYTDVAPTSAIYSGVGFALDKKISPEKHVTADITIETSGAPS
jgi:hypothetical protein